MTTPQDVVDMGGALPFERNDYKILALSGGGYRGLFTACVLEELEKSAGQPLSQVFDLIAGTSIGGILAGGLALGVPAKHLAEGLRKHGKSIFPKRRFARIKQAVSHKYSSLPLESAIKAILPDYHSHTLKSINANLLITAVSNTIFEPVLFGSGKYSNNTGNLTVLDAMMATTAAPTYFSPWNQNYHSYVDGGLIANAPDLVALTESLSRVGSPLEYHWLLSVGTVSPNSTRASAEEFGNMGAYQWMKAQRLFELTITAQEQLAVAQARKLLSPRYLRIDPKPSEDQSRVIGLDKANNRATKTLEQLAASAVAAVQSSQSKLLSRLLH